RAHRRLVSAGAGARPQLSQLPARRPSAEGRSMQHGARSRASLAVSRHRSDGTRSQSARSAETSSWYDESDSAERVSGSFAQRDSEAGQNGLRNSAGELVPQGMAPSSRGATSRSQRTP